MGGSSSSRLVLPVVAVDLTPGHPPVPAPLGGAELAIGDLLAKRGGGHSEECRRFGEGHLVALACAAFACALSFAVFQALALPPIWWRASYRSMKAASSASAVWSVSVFFMTVVSTLA
jgi:hypothetical protein